MAHVILGIKNESNTDQLLRNSIAEMLEIRGHRATKVADVSEAISALAQEDVEVVLLDNEAFKNSKRVITEAKNRGVPHVILMVGERVDKVVDGVLEIDNIKLRKIFVRIHSLLNIAVHPADLGNEEA